MITYSLYSIFKIILLAHKEENIDVITVENRINDILINVINFSSIIMLYGVSYSIKSSVDR
jgi:hypothetical protein